MFVPGYKKLIKANVDRFVMFEDGISVSLVLAVKHYDRNIEFTEALISQLNNDAEADEEVLAPPFKSLFIY